MLKTKEEGPKVLSGGLCLRDSEAEQSALQFWHITHS